jgi:hypothetical protein
MLRAIFPTATFVLYSTVQYSPPSTPRFHIPSHAPGRLCCSDPKADSYHSQISLAATRTSSNAGTGGDDRRNRRHRYRTVTGEQGNMGGGRRVGLVYSRKWVDMQCRRAADHTYNAALAALAATTELHYSVCTAMSSPDTDTVAKDPGPSSLFNYAATLHKAPSRVDCWRCIQPSHTVPPMLHF